MPLKLPTLISLASLLLSAPAWGDSTTYRFGSPGFDVTRPDNTEDVTGSAIGLIGNARIRGQLGTNERCSSACNAFPNRACFCTTNEGAPDADNAIQATFTCRDGGLLTPETLSYELKGTPANVNQTGTLHLFASRDYVNYQQRDFKILDNTTTTVSHDVSDRGPTPMEVYELRPQKTPDSGQSLGVAQVDNLTLEGECSEGGDTGTIVATGLIQPAFAYQAVCAVNEIKGNTASPLIEMIDENGVVTQSSNPTISGYGSAMLMDLVYGGKRWCRVTPALGDVIRARIYHVTFPSGGSNDGSEAR